MSSTTRPTSRSSGRGPSTSHLAPPRLRFLARVLRLVWTGAAAGAVRAPSVCGGRGCGVGDGCGGAGAAGGGAAARAVPGLLTGVMNPSNLMRNVLDSGIHPGLSDALSCSYRSPYRFAMFRCSASKYSIFCSCATPYLLGSRSFHYSVFCYCIIKSTHYLILRI